MPYQSFSGEASDSNSSLKLEKLQLPERLDGKSVLDIGCNEGFFCAEAIRRGAGRVVGLDIDEEMINRARQRTNQVEFRCLNWWNLPDEKFDWILFLSAIHYEKNPKELLAQLRSRLETSGTLILECGVVRTDLSNCWHVVERHDGILSYPSWGKLLETLLDGFAVRDIGQSVTQSGDPITRSIFHCSHLTPSVVLVRGNSGAGKTVLAREFRKFGVRVINLDFVYTELRGYPGKKDSKMAVIADLLEDSLIEDGRGGVDVFLRKVVVMKQEETLNEILIRLLGKDQPLTILEGYHLEIAELRNSLRRHLEAESFRVYELSMDH